MKKLRSNDGCPWDKEQTHETLKSCLVEEVYEVIDAVDTRNPEKMKEELADLFFLIIFYCQIADDNNIFDIENLMDVCLEKMIRRHPHVFGDKSAHNADDALQQWNEIKKQEVLDASQDGQEDKSVINNIPKHLPALQKAQKVQKKVARVGFDWEVVADVIAKVEEELGEVKVAIDKESNERVAEEIGDLLFAVVNLSRHLKLDSEDLLRKSISKFIDRFKNVESSFSAVGKSIEDCTLEELDNKWNELKANQPMAD